MNGLIAMEETEKCIEICPLKQIEVVGKNILIK
jgi:hypothetical protein